jgi:O-antigen/teichoic acid export membrane protein
MPPPSLDTAIAARRETAIRQGAAASVAAKGVAALCLLAQAPLALGYLGAELFGLWMTLVGVIAIMAFADFGIGASAQNEAAAALGRDDPPAARAACAHALALLALLGVALATVLFALWAFAPWTQWLGIGNPGTAAEARGGLAAMIALFCLNLPLTSVARLAYGLRLGWLANAWYAAVNALALAAVALAVKLRLDFFGFVVATAMPALIGHLGLAIHVFKKLGWRFSALPRPTSSGVRRLWREGLPFVLPQLSVLAFTSAPAPIIAGVLGAAAVTPYVLAQRLLLLFGVLQQIVLTQLWPAYTEARARGDTVWLRKTYRRSLVVSAWGVALPQVAFGAWGGMAFALWTRGAVTLAPELALALGAQAAVFALSQPPAFLLNSEGRMRGQTIFGTLATALALGALPWALGRFGLLGAPLALGGAWLLVFWPAIFLEAPASLRVTTTRVVPAEVAR